MRQQTELAVCGAAAVGLAFFSWPVPEMVKDVYRTGVGRLVVLLAVIYLAKFQSVPLAILLSIYYVKAARAAYHEDFESGDGEKKKKDKKEEKEEEKEVDPSRTSSSGKTAASSGSSAGASARDSGTTENYQNFASF